MTLCMGFKTRVGLLPVLLLACARGTEGSRLVHSLRVYTGETYSAIITQDRCYFKIWRDKLTQELLGAQKVTGFWNNLKDLHLIYRMGFVNFHV